MKKIYLFIYLFISLNLISGKKYLLIKFLQKNLNIINITIKFFFKDIDFVKGTEKYTVSIIRFKLLNFLIKGFNTQNNNISSLFNNIYNNINIFSSYEESDEESGIKLLTTSLSWLFFSSKASDFLNFRKKNFNDKLILIIPFFLILSN